MSILLFKFPILVIAEIIKSMDHRDIFISSLASIRTKNVIKTSMTRSQSSVSLDTSYNEFRCDLKNLKIEAKQDPPNQEAVTYKIGSSSYQVVILPNIINIYWIQGSEKVNCAKNLMTHISEVFNKPTVYCFTMASMGTGETTPDHFKIDKMVFHSKVHWVKLDDYMECKDINLSGTTRYRTPAILNAFIRKWVDADCRLESLKVLFRNDNFDFAAIANGLGEVQQNGIQQFVEFEGANGKRAKISKNGTLFELKVRK